jgi:hypothetical protein
MTSLILGASTGLLAHSGLNCHTPNLMLDPGEAGMWLFNASLSILLFIRIGRTARQVERRCHASVPSTATKNEAKYVPDLGVSEAESWDLAPTSPSNGRSGRVQTDRCYSAPLHLDTVTSSG